MSCFADPQTREIPYSPYHVTLAGQPCPTQPYTGKQNCPFKSNHRHYKILQQSLKKIVSQNKLKHAKHQSFKIGGINRMQLENKQFTDSLDKILVQQCQKNQNKCNKPVDKINNKQNFSQYYSFNQSKQQKQIIKQNTFQEQKQLVQIPIVLRQKVFKPLPFSHSYSKLYLYNQTPKKQLFNRNRNSSTSQFQKIHLKRQIQNICQISGYKKSSLANWLQKQKHRNIPRYLKTNLIKISQFTRGFRQ